MDRLSHTPTYKFHYFYATYAKMFNFENLIFDNLTMKCGIIQELLRSVKYNFYIVRDILSYSSFLLVFYSEG